MKTRVAILRQTSVRLNMCLEILQAQIDKMITCWSWVWLVLYLYYHSQQQESELDSVCVFAYIIQKYLAFLRHNKAQNPDIWNYYSNYINKS